MELANAVGVNHLARRIRLAETEVLIIGCGIAGATAEGVRKFQPRVHTLGYSVKKEVKTPKVFAN